MTSAPLDLPLIGSSAPDFSLMAHTGKPITLSYYRGRRHVALFFVRTYTCIQCRQHVRQLAASYAEFQRHETEILVIMNADEIGVKGYADVTGAPFPILIDEDHSVYEAYGLSKHFLFATRTASVVVDKAGQLRYFKSAANPWGWRVESDELLDQVRALGVTA